MKKIASGLLALSLLTGVAGQAFAANDNDTTNLQDLERQTAPVIRAGKSSEQVEREPARAGPYRFDAAES